MKSKIYFLLALFTITSGLAVSQVNNLLVNGFDGYEGLPSQVAPGWYYSWNDSSATSRSYYPTAGNCGDSVPAYKFGLDSVTVISPSFAAPDSLRFWMKGNGSVQDSNTFNIYVSDDSISWTVLSSMDSISASGTEITLPLASTNKHIKFFFRKFAAGYNVGLDDVKVLKNSAVGVPKTKLKEDVRVFPTPTTGLVHVSMTTARAATITVYDLLGKALTDVKAEKTGDKSFTLNLAGKDRGFYFIRITTHDGTVTRRITLQ